ncbi:diacylglycerol kinase family protein [Microcoleus sp.]|uniref:diacylglycerol kinase family protein n=1 Tax=Microcoleus sp. TaxID=44472 RepID=UPI0035232AC8
MTLEQQSKVSNIAQLLTMPPDSSNQTVNGSKKALKYNRELSWKIASNLAISFRYAWAGLSYAFETQRNFRIHTVIGTLAIGLGVFLHLKPVEISVIGITIGIVLAMELLNTAIESLVDLTVGQSYHELAKIAKDCAAGAVLVSAMAAAIVAVALLLPPFWTVIQLAIAN